MIPNRVPIAPSAILLLASLFQSSTAADIGPTSSGGR